MTGVPGAAWNYTRRCVNDWKPPRPHPHGRPLGRLGPLLPKGRWGGQAPEISSKAIGAAAAGSVHRARPREEGGPGSSCTNRPRKLDIGLPPNRKRIPAAHLRRFHPEASAALREALGRAASDSPHSPAHWSATGRRSRGAPTSKCLTGEARDVYVRKAAADLGLRCENAALRVIVPDRTPAREEVPTRRRALAGPRRRRREAGLVTGPGRIPKTRLEGSREGRARRTLPSRRAPGGVPRRPGIPGAPVGRHRPRARRRDGDPGRQGSTPDARGPTWETRPARALRLIAATLGIPPPPAAPGRRASPR